MEAIIALLLVGCAGMLMAHAVGDAVREQRIYARVANVSGNRGSLFRRVFDVVLARGEELFRRFPIVRFKMWCAARLAVAGCEESMNADRWCAVMAVTACSGAVLSCAYIHTSWVCAFIGALAGVASALLWLEHRRRVRSAAIERALPTVLDMLTLSVEAGLDFGQALERVTTGITHSPLVEELERVVGALKLGSSRSDALRRMGARVGVPSLRSLAATLVQADRLGASIGPVLRAHAQRARDERLARAERAGMYAAQKALVPLIVCIMPVTFIVIFGPLVARYLTGGLNALF